jgi:hypothetical protein
MYYGSVVNTYRQGRNFGGRVPASETVAAASRWKHGVTPPLFPMECG